MQCLPKYELSSFRNLTQIAEENGFASTRSMNKVFNNIYGKNASDFYKESRS